MNVKNFLKPTFLKAIIFLFVGVVYLYFAKESVSAAGLSFAFFYTAYGFPFQYLITGDVGKISSIVRELFLGNYFGEYGNFLFNPVAFALDIILIYLFSCFMGVLFEKMKASNKK
ncbi:MAG: hypothetical protein AABX32_00845 [Nanoarchaeota archaeon]